MQTCTLNPSCRLWWGVVLVVVDVVVIVVVLVTGVKRSQLLDCPGLEFDNITKRSAINVRLSALKIIN